jgi:dihydroxyacetone kinase-like protein
VSEPSQAPDWLPQAIDAAARAVADNAEALMALDMAIGDGDHCPNLRRGLAALEEQAAALAALPVDAALQKAGMTVVGKVGGAAGPLYGSLLMAMGKAADPAAPLDAPMLARMVSAGVAAVKARGKADIGEKTMLDVLVPVEQALMAAAAAGDGPAQAAARVRTAAEAGLESTRMMRATKGRASFLGERSIGHLDPGAMSSCVLVKACCSVAETRG